MVLYQKLYRGCDEEHDLYIEDQPWNFWLNLTNSIRYAQKHGERLGQDYYGGHKFTIDQAYVYPPHDKYINPSFFEFETASSGVPSGYGIEIVKFNSNGELRNPDNWPMPLSIEFWFIPMTNLDSGNYIIYQ